MRIIPTAVAASLVAASTAAAADVTFANWDSISAGSLNGIGFTVQQLAGGDVIGYLNSGMFSGYAYDTDAHGNPGQQTGLSYEAVEEYTITFDTAISDLSLYLSGWRSPAAFGYSSYTVSEAFSINDAFEGAVEGNQITTTSGFTNGILSFSDPVTSITITHAYDGGAIHNSNQSVTLAQSTTSPVVPGVGGVAVLAGIVTLGRRRRR